VAHRRTLVRTRHGGGERDKVRDFITDLAWRGAHFDPKRPDFDNSLKVSNDGRNVSMDERMANLGEPLDGGRVDLVATQVARVWDQSRDTVYADDDGRAEPLPGGLQIVFCDRSTPHLLGARRRGLGLLPHPVCGVRRGHHPGCSPGQCDRPAVSWRRPLLLLYRIAVVSVRSCHHSAAHLEDRTQAARPCIRHRGWMEFSTQRWAPVLTLRAESSPRRTWDRARPQTPGSIRGHHALTGFSGAPFASGVRHLRGGP